MIAPRIEIDLGKVEQNTRSLVDRLGSRGIQVTGVTKATLGSPDVARAMLRGGVTRLGDSRVDNLEALKEAGIRAPMMLLRAPDPAWADRAVAVAQSSLVSDLDVAYALSAAAGKRGSDHGIVLMVELGDLREGVLASDVLNLARIISRTRHLKLAGIGTNLACRSGVIPGDDQMQELSGIAGLLSGKLGIPDLMVTGGNSANLNWALGRGQVGRVNDLRLGEAILLGADPLTRTPIEGLHSDAFIVVGAVIESIEKPSSSWGTAGHPALGAVTTPRERGTIIQTIVSLGEQDVDARGLVPPAGITVLAASSDHLVLETPARMVAGTEIRFGVDYSCLLRAMTSPFVAERVIAAIPAERPTSKR
ncbi:alanine racemase [Demequina oxidasica]|uniref:alanine racemase n=1 Tax=Demequina oxidasica TaxID=676199 RepID=UPI0007807476|nr:alanine racemase [Demequina oxidasica]